MIQALRVVFVCAAIAAGTACAQTNGDAIVARGVDMTIKYRQIRCGAPLRDDERRCLAAEQRQLAGRILDYAIDAAEAQYGLHLTAEELARLESVLDSELPLIRSATARESRVLSGALRVRQGENVDVVAAELERMGIPRSELTRALDEFQTEAAARQVAERDHFPAAEDAARRSIARGLYRAKIRALISSRAAKSERTFDEEAAVVWREVVTDRRITVTDRRYRMPDFQGVFREHAKQIRF